MNLGALKRRIATLESKISERGEVELNETGDVFYKGKSIFPAKFRNYQQQLFDQVLSGTARKAFYMLPRRAGKDFTFFRILTYYCLKYQGTNAIYLFPDLQMARKIIWDGVFIHEGKNYRYVDFIPSEICSLNNTMMRIKFNNGSTIQLMGTLDTNKLRGITSNIIIASEYCFMRPDLLSIISPIISASKGVLLLNSTPNGLNFAYHQYNQFHQNDSWLTVKETVETLLDEDGNRYITQEMVQGSVDDGLSKYLIEQEFYCECKPDISKVIYAREMQDVKILPSSIIRGLPIHFAFDLGLLEPTAIVGFQIMPNGMPCVVMCYHNSNQPWIHYYEYLQQWAHNQRIGKFVLPHDAAKRNGSSITLDDVADEFRSFGANVMHLKRPKSLDGFIALVKSYMGGMIIDASCVELIEALNNYQKDDHGKPIHDGFSHYASAFGYMCQALYYGIEVANAAPTHIVRYGI